MNVFRRKNKWQRAVGKVAASAPKGPAIKTGAVAVTGILGAIAASAAVSAARRKSES